MKKKKREAETLVSPFLSSPDYSAKGIDAKTSFVGCIRNVQLDGKMQYIGSGSAIGSVKMDSCPVN